MTHKANFLAKYGSREDALMVVTNPMNHHSWHIQDALRNPNLTKEDLLSLSHHKNSQISHLATNECLNRGIETTPAPLPKW
jgi:hypothetical protein